MKKEIILTCLALIVLTFSSVSIFASDDNSSASNANETQNMTGVIQDNASDDPSNWLIALVLVGLLAGFLWIYSKFRDSQIRHSYSHNNYQTMLNSMLASTPNTQTSLPLNHGFQNINIGETKRRSDSFRLNPHKRFCGVEIECLNNNRYSHCFNESQLRMLGFSQGTDGSLDGDGDGTEFRSVPCNGDKLFEMIGTFTNHLKERKFYVNKSCGLHAHFEVKPSLEFVKKLYYFYNKYEQLFFTMMPKSRQSNDFCQKFNRVDNFRIPELISAKNMPSLKRVFYEDEDADSDDLNSYQRQHGNDKRYCWVNFHSIFYRGTIEIRSHSGTIDGEKIKNWLRIHLKVLDFIESHTLEEIKNLPKTKKFFLSLFSRRIQSYIQERWKKFTNGRMSEEAVNSPRPARTNPISLAMSQGAAIQLEDGGP